MGTKLFFLFLLFWCISISIHEACAQSEVHQTRVSLESIDFVGSYLRACSSKLIFLDDNVRRRVFCSADMDNFEREATFIMREPGLTGDAGTVSFESVMHPGHYISSDQVVAVVERSPLAPSPDPAFRKRTTFIKLVGRVNGDNFFSFKSVAGSDSFIRQCSGPFGQWFVVMRDNVFFCVMDAATFDRRITFRVAQPLTNSTEQNE